MFDSNYPSHRKPNYFDDTTFLPTAERSPYQRPTEPFLDSTPTKLDYLSPAKHSARLSDARKSISEAIELASAKHSRNR
jgi:hypothetical protein